MSYSAELAQSNFQELNVQGRVEASPLGIARFAQSVQVVLLVLLEVSLRGTPSVGLKNEPLSNLSSFP
jgi:hypothetical protein